MTRVALEKPARAIDDRPDVLVIQCDSLPPDLIGAYGDPNNATPNIDALARTGVRFDASCNAPLCTPSRASMMTGVLASRLGCFDNASEFSAEYPTVAHSQPCARHSAPLRS